MIPVDAPVRRLHAASRPWLDRRAVWRWHFYAALLCLPFVVWLSLTGMLYLFKPQIEAWIDRDCDRLSLTTPPAPPSAQVAAALAAVPGASLHQYVLPADAHAAARVIVGVGTREVRVYVHPGTLAILKQVDEDARLMKQVFRLHGELMIGDRGSLLVELAACWTIVMIVSGLFLWWPRDAQGRTQGWGGVIYPRLGAGRRGFWRDMHAVTGVWVSALALFLLLTGLPWAKNWGAYFREIRQITGTAVAKQDWPAGRSAELADRLAQNIPADPHAEHHHGGAMGAMPGMAGGMDFTPLDIVAAQVAPLGLEAPVLVAPPHHPGAFWTAKSDTQNRPHRVVLTYAADGTLAKREDFAQRHWVDRVVGVGIAAHEGQLFGWANQALGVIAGLGLLMLSVSGVVMWWRRRPRASAPGALCPPPLTRGARRPVRSPLGFAGVLVALAVLLPLMGASLVAVLLLERLVLRRIPPVRDWLGLRPA